MRFELIDQGKVIGILGGGRARVKVMTSAACKSCGICKGIGGEVTMEAENKIGAKPGDLVKIEVLSKEIIKAGLLLFIVPVIALFLGYFIGGVAWSFILLFTSFFLIYLCDRYLAPKTPSCKIIEVLQNLS